MTFSPFKLLLALVLAPAIYALGTGAAHATEVPGPDPALASAPPMPSALTIEETEEAEEPSSPAPAAPLEWSENPGVYESDLFRRFGNPLYLESRRQIGEEELLEAKRRDAEQMWKVLESFIDLLSDKGRMSKFELASQMGDALLRIDEGTWTALRVGGAAYPLAAAIQNLRASLLKQWRVSSAADPGVKALLDAEARIPTVETESLAIRFLALIQAGDGDEKEGPIRRYEFGTALMNEDPVSIRKIYGALRGELKFTMQKQLTLLLEEIDREEIEFAGRDRKVAVVIGLLGLNPADLGLRDRPPSF